MIAVNRRQRGQRYNTTVVLRFEDVTLTDARKLVSLTGRVAPELAAHVVSVRVAKAGKR